ncbi:MAG: protoglobin domain-containing protein [Anaerolineales bacterium]
MSPEEELRLEHLLPTPEERWRHLLRFVGWNEQTRQAAARSIEIIFRRGHELVVNTYDYLRSVPETAAILGWEENVDEAHLEERRRFFTLWLARTLGLDTSDEFAHYLFRAGKYHAGHGPRRIHTPPQYITASIGLVQASFARFMAEAGMGAQALAEASAAWSKYLSVQLDMMLMGYQVAKEAEHGDFTVKVQIFGRLRPMLGKEEFQLQVDRGSPVAEALRKFFNYFPQARQEALQPIWRSQEKKDSLWVEVYPVYVPRPAWRVLLNGRDLAYAGGFYRNRLKEEDVLALFPPGR